MKYGAKPKQLSRFDIDCKEMMFYQYLPIKVPGNVKTIYEPRLKCFDEIVGVINCDFIGENGLDAYVDSYAYLTAKYLYQASGCPFNRPGWHCDGFMTEDVNYVWSDKSPTEFNASEFSLTLDDELSLIEMGQQADPEFTFCYDAGTLLRLNQYNVHRVAEGHSFGMRKFLKVSFSKDKYDLLGNSHNYLLDYNWPMKKRAAQRNIPQSHPLK